uniref:Monocarboxylate transporter n=1 Tax=Rhipicephalus zambeziensis TaxID=60191 RepID=A0A224Z4R8_9ACAR
MHVIFWEYGFKGAFLITGGLMLNAVSACIIFKAPPWEASKSKSAKVSPTAPNEGTDGQQRRGSVASLERKEQVATINGTYKAVVEGGASADAETNIPKDKDARPKASLKSTSILQSCEDFTSYANGSSPDIPADITVVSSHEISEGRAQTAANGTTTTYKFPPSPKPVQFRGFSFRFLRRKPSGDGDVPSYSRLDGAYNIQNGEASGSGTGVTPGNGAVAKPWTVPEPEVVAVDAAVESLRRHSLAGREALVASGGGDAGTSHWSFLREPVFYMVTVTCAISVYTLLVLMILVDLAVDKGFTRRDGAVFLSVTAIGDACARLVAGALSDRSFCDRRVLMSASAMLTGALCASLPTMRPDRYAVTALMCALFGWSNGSVVVLFGPVLADQLGVENLGLSAGVTRFVMGIAYLACPKITGYFKDEIGSYDGLLHMVSIGSFLVCIMWTTEFTYRRIKKRRATNSAS